MDLFNVLHVTTYYIFTKLILNIFEYFYSNTFLGKYSNRVFEYFPKVFFTTLHSTPSFCCRYCLQMFARRPTWHVIAYIRPRAATGFNRRPYFYKLENECLYTRTCARGERLSAWNYMYMRHGRHKALTSYVLVSRKCPRPAEA